MSALNYRLVISQLSLVFGVLSAVMVLTSGLFFTIETWRDKNVDPEAVIALGMTGTAGLIVFALGWLASRKRERTMGRRDAMLLVAASWIIGAGLCAMPFFVWANLRSASMATHPFASFANCYFEAMSGLTTTGASVLRDAESVPRSLLLWRSTIHWLGGLGIVVLFVAILPSIGMGSKRMFRMETSGLSKEGMRQTTRDTARMLWYIYLALTIALVTALLLAGMDLFDAVCHAFGTVSTGGFSTKTASIAAFNSPAVEVITIVFMVGSGVNFGLFYMLLRGRTKAIWKNPELQLFLAVMVLGSLIVSLSLAADPAPIVLADGRVIDSNAANAIRHGSFAVASIGTTTGFSTADYNTWPFIAKAVLCFLMFTGACAGSTSGGLKMIRLWIVFKVLIAEIERAFRPQVVRPIRVDQTPIDAEMRLTVMTYVVGYVVLLAAGGIIVMLLEQWNSAGACSISTGMSASLACLSNIGPGFEMVGPVGNYAFLTEPSKLTLSLLMALGRVEILAIIALLTPRFWHES